MVVEDERGGFGGGWDGSKTEGGFGCGGIGGLGGWVGTGRVGGGWVKERKSRR